METENKASTPPPAATAAAAAMEHQPKESESDTAADDVAAPPPISGNAGVGEAQAQKATASIQQSEKKVCVVKSTLPDDNTMFAIIFGLIGTLVVVVLVALSSSPRNLVPSGNHPLAGHILLVNQSLSEGNLIRPVDQSVAGLQAKVYSWQYVPNARALGLNAFKAIDECRVAQSEDEAKAQNSWFLLTDRLAWVPYWRPWRCRNLDLNAVVNHVTSGLQVPQRDQTAIHWRGYLDIPKAGLYRFRPEVDGALRLVIGNVEVWNQIDGSRQAEAYGTKELALRQQQYPVDIWFVQTRYTASLKVLWATPYGGSNWTMVDRWTTDAQEDWHSECLQSEEWRFQFEYKQRLDQLAQLVDKLLEQAKRDTTQLGNLGSYTRDNVMLLLNATNTLFNKTETLGDHGETDAQLIGQTRLILFGFLYCIPVCGVLWLVWCYLTGRI